MRVDPIYPRSDEDDSLADRPHQKGMTAHNKRWTHYLITAKVWLNVF